MTEENPPIASEEPPIRHDDPAEAGPPRGVRAMALFRWLLIAVMAVVAALSVAHSFGLVDLPSANAAQQQYYCPMHPQVVQDGPGECPICSMSLVPKESSPKSSKANAGSTAAPSSHDGHRHNPSDPYICPMHPEETGPDPSARCPICKMKLEKRAEGSAPGSPAPSGSSAPADIYFCPMHPDQTSMDPNARCPICEMKLEKGKSTGSGATGMAAPPTPAMPQGVPGLVPIELGPDRIQLIGVRTAAATRADLVPELRTVGFVTAEESRLARVHTRFSGWVERLVVPTTGQKVRAGQVLANVYNVELLPAQQEFLAARRWSSTPAPSGLGGATAGSPTASLEQDARTRLELLGMSRGEIDRVAQTGKPTRTIAVTAPIGGYVVAKNVTQGTYVQPGTELFEIADLSQVWVLADIYEYEIARVSLGQLANVEVAAYPGQRFSGKVTFIYPTLDANTRTLRVRVELPNPHLNLRPGMYGDVVIRLGEAQGVVIPSEALVDTGEFQYVFLAKEGGRFEPRRVRAGARSGDRVQVLEGLEPGEVVVTTANFLLDSESRLRAAIEGGPTPSAPTPGESSAPSPKAPPSACDADFDKTRFADKYRQCRECERVHRGMGTMEEDCKKAIPKPWR